jgi:uncharacterized protein (TIGR03032 family)
LAGARASLAFTTYQAGKLFLIGLKPDGRLSIFERTFSRCMGLGTGPARTLWMSSLYQLWRFENFLDPGTSKDGYDAVYVPVTGYTTGDIDIHDIDAGTDGRPIFVATRFNCLATTAERASFTPLWRPPFIDRLAAEDRCHLNGLAMRDGLPAFATCVAATNLAEAWREHRRDGGIVIDVVSGETVARPLDAAFPAASPRPALAGAVGHRRVRPRGSRDRTLRAGLLPAGFRAGYRVRRRPCGHRGLPAA